MRKSFFKGFIQACKNDKMIGTGVILGLDKGIIFGTKCISIFWHFGFTSFYLYKRGALKCINQ